MVKSKSVRTFAPFKTANLSEGDATDKINMVRLAQLVRASDCGSEGRGFDPHTSPHKNGSLSGFHFFFVYNTVASTMVVISSSWRGAKYSVALAGRYDME